MEDILHGKISKQRLERWLDEVNKKLEGDKQLKKQMREEKDGEKRNKDLA